MSKQLQLTLVTDVYAAVAATPDLESALSEMLCAYFHDVVSPEENATHDRKDHHEP